MTIRKTPEDICLVSEPECPQYRVIVTEIALGKKDCRRDHASGQRARSLRQKYGIAVNPCSLIVKDFKLHYPRHIELPFRISTVKRRSNDGGSGSSGNQALPEILYKFDHGSRPDTFGPYGQIRIV